MVTIKIQSSEDIIQAYLKTLGFEDIVLTDEFVAKINDKDIVGSLDELLLKQAKRIFDKKMTKEQMVALLKIAFLTEDTAKKYGLQIFDEDFQLSAFEFRVVPEYKISKMLPQVID